MPSHPLVASIVLLSLHSVRYLAKLWIFIVEFFAQCIFCLVYGFFEIFELRLFGQQELLSWFINIYERILVVGDMSTKVSISN